MIADKRVLSLDAEGAESIGSWWMRRLIASRREAGRQDEGFTLIEVIIVVVVIAILSAVSVPVYNGMQDQAKITAIDSTAHHVSTIIGTGSVFDRQGYEIAYDDLATYEKQAYDDILGGNGYNGPLLHSTGIRQSCNGAGECTGPVDRDDTVCYMVIWMDWPAKDFADLVPEDIEKAEFDKYYAAAGQIKTVDGDYLPCDDAVDSYAQEIGWT